MKRVFLYILTVFTLLSCGKSKDQFVLTGEFKHLQQGEFYLYSADGGSERIDTVRLEAGEFEITVPVEGPSVYYLLYPNYQEQVLFVQGGDHIEMTGDAGKLNETVVEGNEDNELMTKFRLDHLKSSPRERLQGARQLIESHPESRVAVYLFQKYFVSPTADLAVARSLYQTLQSKQPDNLKLKVLKSDMETIQRNKVGCRFPDLTWPTVTGDTVRIRDLKERYVLLSFWATWGNTSYAFYQMRKLQRKYQSELGLLSFSLDVSPDVLKQVMKRDSIRWDVVCDYRGWNNPLMHQLDIYEIPMYLLLDQKQVVVAKKRDLKDMIAEIEKRIPKS